MQGYNTTTEELAESLKNLIIGSKGAIEIDEDDRSSGKEQDFFKSPHTNLMERTKYQRNHEKFINSADISKKVFELINCAMNMIFDKNNLKDH